MIVTHPLLGPQYTYMSIDQLAEAASLGAYMEVTAGTVFRDTPARTRSFEAIRKVGAAMAFISSDSGLTGGPNHPDALAMAATVAGGEEPYKMRRRIVGIRKGPVWGPSDCGVQND